jgi:hypothetical protein
MASQNRHPKTVRRDDRDRDQHSDKLRLDRHRAGAKAVLRGIASVGLSSTCFLKYAMPYAPVVAGLVFGGLGLRDLAGAQCRPLS